MHARCRLIGSWRVVAVVIVAAAALLDLGNRGVCGEALSVPLLLKQSAFQGGLIVYLGDNVDTLASLADQCKDSSLVEGLSMDPAAVAAARVLLKQRGVYGRVAMDRWDGSALPLIDNLVNLLIVDGPAEVARAELLRVLVPQGTAWIKRAAGPCEALNKPRPAEMDEWTHYLHDSTNNAVGHDTLVGPPRHAQWVGSPLWSRQHEHMSSMDALVSSRGRIFYVFDEAPALSIQLPSQWKLIARDAFNGVILWKRPIPSWHNSRWPLKSGPAFLPRRLVAVGDTVFATLSYQGPIEAVSAATGKTLRAFESTRGAEELLVNDNVLFALVNPTPVNYERYTYDTSNAVCWVETKNVAQRYPWDEKPRMIQAIDVRSGNLLWRAQFPVLPLSLAVDAGKVYFHDGKKIVALDRQNGSTLWQSPDAGRRSVIPTFFGGTLVVYGDVVLFTGGDGRMSAYSAATGRRLWDDKQPPTGHNCPLDILAAGGLVWNAAIAGGVQDGIFRGRDPHSGKVVKEFPPDVDTSWFHHRCYRAKATDQYLLTSRTGVEFVDIRKQHWDINHWVRGACIYGVMPCNGLLYAPQHPCICYAESKLNGFCALAPASAARPPLLEGDDSGRLSKGPAYQEAQGRKDTEARSDKSAEMIKSDSAASQSPFVSPFDWPTYRHDPARSGLASTALAAQLAPAWTADVGGRLSSVTIAGGRVYVASIDDHTVHALAASTGQPLWIFTAGGRVDSPPTCWQDRVLFGSADGYVYCLRAADGELAWRYRAAPRDLRMMSLEQIESVWPVHGAVLIHGNVAYCTAGRSMFLDGGIRLLRLDPLSGRKLSETVLDDRDPTTGAALQAKIRGLNMPVALPDILSCDGKYVYMRSQKFTLDGIRPVISTPKEIPADQSGDVHLFCPTGLLDDSWFHRGYWMYGKTFSSGCDYWFRAGRFVPAGRLLVFDDQTVYGFGRKPNLFAWTPVLQYRLFAADKLSKAERIEHVVKADKAMKAKDKWNIFNRFLTTAAPKEDISAVGLKWSENDPDLLVRTMLLSAGKLFVAGPPNVVNEERVFQDPFDPQIREQLARQTAVLDGSEGAVFHVVDALTGRTLSTLRLPSLPVWDGMASAQKRLYVATTAGKVICFTGK